MKWELPNFARRAINSVPDVNGQPDEVQAFAGIFGSLALHLVLLILWLLLQNGLIQRLLKALPQKEVPIEIFIKTIPPMFERLTTLQDEMKDKGRIDSAGLTEAKEAPKNATFESDKNLEAGSKEKPKGVAPLPQNNATKRTADNSLVQREAKTGTLDPRQIKPAPDVSRLGSNGPSSKVTSPSTSKVASTSTSKKPAPKPEPASETQHNEDMDDLGGEIVFRKVAAGAAAPVKVSETVGVGKKQKAVEDIPEAEAQEGKQQSKVNGGLEQNGKEGVSATRAPVAVYMKSVSRAMAARWNELIKPRMDSLDTGSAKVRFRVAMNGSVREVRLESCTANKEFADLCLDVVKQTRLDPPPPEAKPLLRDGLLDIPFTFSLY